MTKNIVFRAVGCSRYADIVFSIDSSIIAGITLPSSHIAVGIAAFYFLVANIVLQLVFICAYITSACSLITLCCTIGQVLMTEIMLKIESAITSFAGSAICIGVAVVDLRLAGIIDQRVISRTSLTYSGSRF